jgi:NAD(P)-dependent dehydrogenase (short-subunit alcohol dehydrogenase family)
MSTILITGCSSGFGQETARLFLDRGWDVIATMRTPREDLLSRSERLRILPLDVTDAQSISALVSDAGPIDALVNNAGIGWMNAVEGTPMAKVREVFETNTFGPIAVTQAFVPGMRERRSGVVVNISSGTTLQPYQFLSVYSASKAAVNTFTASLALELEPFGVRVRLVIPGRAPDTRFGSTAQAAVAGAGGFPAAYDELMKQLLAWRGEERPDELTRPGDVTEAIWRAITDPASPDRIPAGADAVAMARNSEQAFHD